MHIGSNVNGKNFIAENASGKNAEVYNAYWYIKL